MFNKHNMKISYSCKVNLEKIVKAHNQNNHRQKIEWDSMQVCWYSCQYPLKWGKIAVQWILSTRLQLTLSMRQSFSSKRKNIEFKITWEVIKKAQPIPDGNKPVCRLCMKEATVVVYELKKTAWKKSELMPTL